MTLCVDGSFVRSMCLGITHQFCKPLRSTCEYNAETKAKQNAPFVWNRRLGFVNNINVFGELGCLVVCGLLNFIHHCFLCLCDNSEIQCKTKPNNYFFHGGRNYMRRMNSGQGALSCLET
jgi:hypothetical protein